MHTLVRRYIKSAVAFLLLGLLVGVVLVIQRELGNGAPHPSLVSAHTHVLLIGFVMFMILGVGQWIFPRPASGDTRYRPALAEAAYWILFVTTAGRFVAEILREWTAAPALRWAIVITAQGQVVGFFVYFAVMWSRIRPVGSRVREARGERF
jgi:heme/copper-type cytochrome/quinol oxidase subunit 1